MRVLAKCSCERLLLRGHVAVIVDIYNEMVFRDSPERSKLNGPVALAQTGENSCATRA